MRILLVEDESELATWLIKALEQSDFVVEWSNDGLVAEKMLAIEEFDAVILDLGLPGKSGHGVLSHLRAADNRVPVMILTARDTLHERVSSLNEGADDFLPKPFALAELEARLHALIRRSRGREHSRLICGSLVLDAGTKLFKLDNMPIALTPREHAMLSTLIHRAGEPISKQLLLDRIFTHHEEVNLEAIEVLVYRLRKKLANSAVRIVTMRGFGYCLEGGDDSREYA
ncbi:MAG: response regulator protein [Herminiimonas sp.]|nr:response regulator protein [Herminiimonas sp.]